MSHHESTEQKPAENKPTKTKKGVRAYTIIFWVIFTCFALGGMAMVLFGALLTA